MTEQQHQERLRQVASAFGKKRVDLAFVELNDEDLENLVAPILSENHEIERLDLSQNNFGVRGVRALVKATASHPTLKSIYLNHNNIGPEGAQVIGDMLLAQQRSVEQVALFGLYLSHNRLLSDGVSFLAHGFARDHNIAHLVLANNKVGDEGVKIIAETTLLHNTRLLKLDLDGNEVGDEGALYLAKALLRNKKCVLRSLFLNFNRITNHGAIALAKICHPGASRLEGLGLLENQIGQEGIVAFGHAAQANPVLRHLRLDHNPSPVTDHLTFYLHYNRKMRLRYLLKRQEPYLPHVLEQFLLPKKRTSFGREFAYILIQNKPNLFQNIT